MARPDTPRTETARTGTPRTIVMTLPLLPGADPAGTAVTLASELTALVALAEGR